MERTRESGCTCGAGKRGRREAGKLDTETPADKEGRGGRSADGRADKEIGRDRNGVVGQVRKALGERVP